MLIILLSYEFTFHYVSIKTYQGAHYQAPLTTFTFHYVSIKTSISPVRTYFLAYLHSTMYLLKQTGIEPAPALFCLFTFHYVSIKTNLSFISLTDKEEFTFHYVSIKTRPVYFTGTIKATIYIPLCIY